MSSIFDNRNAIRREKKEWYYNNDFRYMKIFMKDNERYRFNGTDLTFITFHGYFIYRESCILTFLEKKKAKRYKEIFIYTSNRLGNTLEMNLHWNTFLIPYNHI